MDNGKHAIKIDTCADSEDIYEVCIYQSIKGLDSAERLETLRKFKIKALKLMESVCNCIFYDILDDLGINIDKETNDEIKHAQNVLKARYNKIMGTYPCKFCQSAERNKCN